MSGFHRMKPLVVVLFIFLGLGSGLSCLGGRKPVSGPSRTILNNAVEVLVTNLVGVKNPELQALYQWLVNNGANIDQKIWRSGIAKSGFYAYEETLYSIAADREKYATLYALSQCGEPGSNMTTPSKETLNRALSYLVLGLDSNCIQDLEKLFQLFIDAGADLNHLHHWSNEVCGHKGKVSLIYSAVVEQKSAVCRALLECGADPDLSGDVRGWTPLYRVILQGGNRDLCSDILSHGANPNVCDTVFRWTPLHCAVKLGRADLCGLLLFYKADSKQAEQ